MSKEKEVLKSLIDGLDDSKIKEVLSLLTDVKGDKVKEASEFMFELCNGMSLKISGDKEITYYNSRGEWIFKHYYKSGKLYYNYKIIYVILCNILGDNIQEINKFVGDWVESNLNWKGLTPNRGVVPPGI